MELQVPSELDSDTIQNAVLAGQLVRAAQLDYQEDPGRSKRRSVSSMVEEINDLHPNLSNKTFIKVAVNTYKADRGDGKANKVGIAGADLLALVRYLALGAKQPNQARHVLALLEAQQPPYDQLLKIITKESNPSETKLNAIRNRRIGEILATENDPAQVLRDTAKLIDRMVLEMAELTSFKARSNNNRAYLMGVTSQIEAAIKEIMITAEAGDGRGLKENKQAIEEINKLFSKFKKSVKSV